MGKRAPWVNSLLPARLVLRANYGLRLALPSNLIYRPKNLFPAMVIGDDTIIVANVHIHTVEQ